MIRTKLVGGLGNQLFQWACARNLQKLYGHSLSYEDHIEVSNRKRDIYRFPNIRFSKDEYIKNSEAPKVGFTISDSFSYNNFSTIDFSNLSALYFLNGYWQGQKYFSEVADEVRQELQPVSSYVMPEGSISLHVRRTDYVGLQDYHPVQALSYYESAVELLNGINNNIYVFSDDIEWCKENFKFSNMQFIHNEDPIIDLWMMSACQNNVIANSTFSWWSAWLNGNPDKKVICPKKWFGPSAPYSDKDILDNDWIKI